MRSALPDRPYGHYKTTIITAALRATGLIARSIFDGATNGLRFRAYVTDTLAPVLRPGYTVILDNLNAHKVAGVHEAIEAVGAQVLYLPPYNPIEQVFAKVGWMVSRPAHATFVLDALWQALHERRPLWGSGLVHHSDRASQYLALRYTERLAEAGVEPSVGSGNSYDNALAETINGLFKAEVIHRVGPWRSFEAVEFATLEWVDWFNTRRLLEPISNVPPAKAEAR